MMASSTTTTAGSSSGGVSGSSSSSSSSSSTIPFIKNEETVRHAPDHLIPHWMMKERTRVLTDPNMEEEEDEYDDEDEEESKKTSKKSTRSSSSKKRGRTTTTSKTTTSETAGKKQKKKKTKEKNGTNKKDDDDDDDDENENKKNNDDDGNGNGGGGCVFYWMQRDLRTIDNWAFLWSCYLANQYNCQLHVLHVLNPPPPTTTVTKTKTKNNNNDDDDDDDENDNNNEQQQQQNDKEEEGEGSLPLPLPSLMDMNMSERHGIFLLDGLQQIHKELCSSDVYNNKIPFHIIMPNSYHTVGQSVYDTCHNIIMNKNNNNTTTTTTIDEEGNDNFDDDDEKKDMQQQQEQEQQKHFVICDFSPLRHIRIWMEQQAKPLFSNHEKKKKQQNIIPMYQVDAHNVVPVWIASNKREVGARTLRPRIQNQLDQYLKYNPYPKQQHLRRHMMMNDHDNNDNSKDNENNVDDDDDDNDVFAIYQKNNNNSNDSNNQTHCPPFEYDTYKEYLQLDPSSPVVGGNNTNQIESGTKAGMKQFYQFLKVGLKKFHESRNDPNQPYVCSNLSPWINYGYISFQRIAHIVLNEYQQRSPNGTASYIEEGIIRRELSDNYLYYTPNDYDKLTGAAQWAQDTLQLHTNDEREYIYNTYELEHAMTYDDLWNAAQLQLINDGTMHGFLRMYWAKKILEWTITPKIALHTAQYFNDKYALDGRDPNGFVGVGWSIMGIHDMGWKERSVFGKIRYMNYAGCKRKFNVPLFVAKYKDASKNAIQASKKHGNSNNNKNTTTTKKRNNTSNSRANLMSKITKKKRSR